MKDISEYIEAAENSGLPGKWSKGLFDRTWIPSDTTQQNILTLATTMMQNDYDAEMYQQYMKDISPTAQLQNYVDAGLNPNLLYQNISSGTPSQPMSQRAPTLRSGEQAEKLAYTKTVLDAINSIMSQTGNIINSIQGIQGIKNNNVVMPLQNQLLRNQVTMSNYAANYSGYPGIFSDSQLSSMDSQTRDLYTNGGLYNFVPIGSVGGQTYYMTDDYISARPEVVNTFKSLMNNASEGLTQTYMDEYLKNRNDLQNQKLEVNRLVDGIIENISQGGKTSDLIDDLLKLTLLMGLSKF